MNLTMDPLTAEGYKSPAQRSRRITEAWFGENMFCPACLSNRLLPTPGATRVVDFQCPGCGSEYQLKAKSAPLRGRLRDAAYAPMIERVRENRAPHFAFLHYSPDWSVSDLLLVPGHFITENAIQPCKPLSERARRHGWVGCNILMDALPMGGRVSVVSSGATLPQTQVREQWARFSWLGKYQAEARGWTTDVLRCIERLGKKEFSLPDAYEFETELSAAHPRNRNVQAKIRQQLQILRDQRVLLFLGHGRYRLM